MNISFIIPLFNEERTIQQCLESILAQMSGEDEIIVADNGSTDKSLEKIKRFPGIKVLLRPDITIGALRNAGAAFAKSEILAFIDADCLLCKDWRVNAIETFKNSKIGATGSKCDIPSSPAWIEKVWYSQREQKTALVKYINSGNLTVRKSVFEEVGGFSEDLITGEDSELGLKINRAGHLVVANPEVRVIHLGNPKKIKDFYKKEKWHAIGMMGTFKISFFDKPLIMTVMFVIFNISAIFAAMLLLQKGNFSTAIIMLLCLTFCIPVVTAVYRALQFGNFRYFLQLTCLYWVYFTARANALFSLGSNKLKGWHSSQLLNF